MKKNNINNYNGTAFLGSILNSLFTANNVKTTRPKRQSYVPINRRRI